MNISPLQIKEYFLKDFTFTVRDNYDFSKPLHEIQMGELKTELQPFQNTGESDSWIFHLSLSYEPKEEDNAPYSFKISLVGFFSVDSKESEERKQSLVAYNAPALLYTIAREILSSTSARAPWGRINLPTVNFLPTTSRKDTGKAKGSKSKGVAGSRAR